MESLAIQHNAATRCAVSFPQHFPLLEQVNYPTTPAGQQRHTIPAADKLGRMERTQGNRRQPTQPTSPDKLVPLASETRSAISTAEAAAHLGRQPQTLRGWACKEDGPVRPLRINGRLAWPVAELRRVLGVA